MDCLGLYPDKSEILPCGCMGGNDMGQFLIHIVATGGHGCERSISSGQYVHGCRRMGCPDCRTREFIERLKADNVQIEHAAITHWPGTKEEVKDDLISGVRTGTFSS